MAKTYLMEHWRTFAISAAAGAFLALVGAFGSDNAPLLVRSAYWVGLMVTGAVFGVAAGFFVARQTSASRSAWRVWIVTALLVTIPMTFVVWGATDALFGTPYRIADLKFYFGAVLTISLAMSAILVSVYMPGAITHGPLPGNTSRRIAFLDRLPPKLMGGAIYAVEAEDHYLRVRTSKGDDLILMRLTDAVRELEGLEGIQVHRSWWVARDGVTQVIRDGARVTLKLKDGTLSPVSRPNVKALRDAGWI